MVNNSKKAQSILEYVLLLLAVTLAFIVMNTYVQRAVNARLHSMEVEMNPPIIVEDITSEWNEIEE